MANFGGFPILAYGYKTQEIRTGSNSDKRNKIYLLALNIFSSSRTFFSSTSYSKVCDEINWFVAENNTSKDIKMRIFKFLLPTLNLPSKMPESLKGNLSSDTSLEDLYEYFFEKSDYGEINFYKIFLKSHYK